MIVSKFLPQKKTDKHIMFINEIKTLSQRQKTSATHDDT